ncbi:MAG TPA: biliverdin-producing heme oxygenase [Allosphingosinicella sp.]|jgi:heme oxygenase
MAQGVVTLSGQGTRFVLRDATHAVHERLHGVMPFARIAGGRLSRGEYADLLERIWRFHAALEQGAGVKQPERMARLESDLAYMGRRVPAFTGLWRLPEREGAALGAHYVAQGSNLGGRVIWRQLDYLFGDGADGRRYFGGAAGDGARWRSLCARIDLEGKSAVAVEGMIAGAEAAFALFERCLETESVDG